jgi:hypothetical protein
MPKWSFSGHLHPEHLSGKSARPTLRSICRVAVLASEVLVADAASIRSDASSVSHDF